LLEQNLELLLIESRLIGDSGCGAGTVTIFLSRNSPFLTFVWLEE